MDIVNYALSKKIKKYVDDISSSNQVQSDWMFRVIGCRTMNQLRTM